MVSSMCPFTDDEPQARSNWAHERLGNDCKFEYEHEGVGAVRDIPTTLAPILIAIDY